VKELGETTQLVTISDDMTLAIWEATSQNQLARVVQNCKPIAMDASLDGKVAFVGSDKGVLRVYDISNRAMPRLIKTYRFYDDQLPINNVKCSSDGRYVMVSSSDSDMLFLVSQEVETEFDVYGHIVLEGYVSNGCFTIHENETKGLAVLSNTTIVGFSLPKKIPELRMEPIDQGIVKPLYRKVDRGLNLIISNIYNGDIFALGDDRQLKKYEFPTEQFAKLDFKKPPGAPVEELKSHDLGTTCWDFSNEIKFMVTGGKDGNFVLRNMNYVAQANELKGHNIYSGGITALCFSSARSTLYTAGGDGSLFAWSVGSKSNPNQPINLQKGEIEDIDKIDNMEDLPDWEIKTFKSILLDQFHKSQESKKEKFKEEIMSELNVIKSKLKELLEENNTVSEIERLERDDFVIDVERQERVINDGEHICEDIRMDADKQVLKLQLIRDKVQQMTWDKMEVPSKAVKSIKADTLIFNYSVRKKTPEEEKLIQQILSFRKAELKEKVQRIEKNIADVLNNADFSKVQEQYIMNRETGKPSYGEDQSVQEAAASFAAKDAEKKLKREKEEKKLQQAGQ